MRRAWAGAVAVIAAFALAACTTEAEPVPRGPDVPEPSASATADPADTTSFAVEEIDRFDDPWAMAFLPDGALLITERTGALHLRDMDAGTLVSVSGAPEVVVAGQGGLGDVVPSPTFEADGVVYLSWVEAGDGGTGAVVGRAVLERAGDAAALQGLEVIWRQQPKTTGDGHFSHRIAFSPDGRHLFVTSGDRQQMDPAQDRSNTLGTIVRLTLDGEAAADNPWNDEGGVTAQIHSYGHRNPLGIAFAPDGTLWSTEMGPQGGDELNLIEAGGNYGWPLASNGSHYGGGEIPDHAAGDGFVAPSVWWNPSISPGSLHIYRGDLFAGWTGDAVIGALSGESLIRVDLEGETAGIVVDWPMGARIRAVTEDADGAIWVLEDAGSGRLLRLTPE
ncbi:PQQ-dependent sugar dehydrogenase [Microbacterium sp. bgisy189]|uniref:PQQ-dependent sugar dehydrogenase n=1 Tax=Microbacterium sp. bgisy189 TaxID=3413798 RepID=UPI003EB91F62